MGIHYGSIDLQGGREGDLVSDDEQRNPAPAGSSGQAEGIGLPELNADIAELEWKREKLPGANEQDVPT